MRRPLWNASELEPARVLWNKLIVDPDVAAYEQLDHDDCDYESVLFARFPNGVALDVMWRPEVKPGGEFTVELDDGRDEWRPYARWRFQTFRELRAGVIAAAQAATSVPSSSTSDGTAA